MRYIRKNNDIIEEYSGPGMGDAWYAANGYIAYTGALPLSRLDLADSVVIELPEPEPTTEIVSKKAVIRVFKGMIAAGDLTAPEMLKNILGGIADLTTDLAPGDDFDLLNPHVSAWLAPMEMTVDDLRAALAALETPEE